jgi:hypothetical protein
MVECWRGLSRKAYFLPLALMLCSRCCACCMHVGALAGALECFWLLDMHVVFVGCCTTGLVFHKLLVGVLSSGGYRTPHTFIFHYCCTAHGEHLASNQTLIPLFPFLSYFSVSFHLLPSGLHFKLAQGVTGGRSYSTQRIGSRKGHRDSHLSPYCS